MSEQLQLRRGTAAQVAAFTGAQGEVVMDTDNNRLVLNDGATVGGWASAKLTEVITNARTAVSDLAYTVLATDRLVAYTALTAARIVSLPTAASYPTGTRLTVIDETGACSGVKTLTVHPHTGDDINGSAADLVISVPYGRLGLESNGTGWFIVDQGYGLAAETVASLPHGANIQFEMIELLASGLSGTTVTLTGAVPANCLVFAVGAYVVTTITGATSYSVGWSGPGGTTSTFGSLLSLPAGSSNDGLIGPVANYSAANITLTAAGSAFTAGAVRLSICIAIFNPSAA